MCEWMWGEMQFLRTKEENPNTKKDFSPSEENFCKFLSNFSHPLQWKINGNATIFSQKISNLRNLPETVIFQNKSFFHFSSMDI